MQSGSPKYFNVELTSDSLVMNCTLTRVPGYTKEMAERRAINLMAHRNQWRVVGSQQV